VQNAIGEDVAAFEIGRDLDFVDGEKAHIKIARHRLDRRHPVARIFRLDLLFAGDERDRLDARTIRDLVVDLAREQPQRQADDAGRMPQHALDREMCLAGVGRPEDSGNARAGRAIIRERGRREGHTVQVFLLDLSAQAVIARSVATKQSILPLRPDGLLRSARNDGETLNPFVAQHHRADSVSLCDGDAVAA
jgi:hypothetical protein